MNVLKTLLAAIAFTCLVACSSKPALQPATTPFDAGREFIDACLKGDFERAGYYMVQDEENKKLLQEATSNYRSKTASQKQKFNEASIQNVTLENLSEKELIINYSNSYDRVGRKVKVIQQNGQWLVDFKYTFNPNL
jgi:hypothetical protein